MRFRGFIAAFMVTAFFLGGASADAAIKFEREWRVPEDSAGVDSILALGKGQSLVATTFGGVIKLGPGGKKKFLPDVAHVTDMALGPDRSAYLLLSGEISRYRLNGHEISSWKVEDSGYGKIDVAPDGSVVLASVEPFGLTRFGPNGGKLGAWKTGPKRQKMLRWSEAMAVDADGTVLLGDSMNGKVRRFSPDGRYLGLFATPGWRPGQTDDPAHIATDDAGRVFIYDWYLNRLQTFTSAGGFLGQFGRSGFGRNSLFMSSDVSAGPGGQLVLDNGYAIREYRVDDDPQPGYPAIAGWTKTWNTRVRPGGSAEVPFTVVNFGTETSHGLRFCIPRRNFRRLLFAPHRCNRLGSLDAGRSKSFKVRVRAPRRADGSVDFEVFVKSADAGFSEAGSQVWLKLRRG